MGPLRTGRGSNRRPEEEETQPHASGNIEVELYILRMQSSVQAQWVELGKEVPMQKSKGTQFWLREGPRRVLVFRPLQTIGDIIDGRHIKETRESFYQPLSPRSDQSLKCSGEVY